MRANEFIVEYRNRLLQYVKSLLPTWPEYVLKDWLVPNKGNFSNLPTDAIKNGIMEKVQGAGLTANSKWQLISDMKFTMDMFEPKTKQLLIGRAGGSSDLGMGIPKDKERHATQAALAQQQGGVRSEPVLLIKSANGYELLEGWHRTIQHFHKFPDGYTGPAYVAVAQSKQGVAEGKITLSTDPNWYGATVDNYQATGPVVNISADRLVGFEPDSKMNQPKSQANVKKIVAGLKKGDKLPPLLVRKYKDGYQVLDGHHRFWAYKLLDTKSIPAQIVPAKDIEEISKQGVAEASLGNVLPWPEVVNKVSSAMKATGWKGKRMSDDAFMFTTRGAEVEDQWYIAIIDNAGDGFFTYALGTVEEGDPHIDDAYRGKLPNTEASVSELINEIREGFGLA